MEGMTNFMDNISLKVDEAGRIIIPLKVRKKYGICKNDTLLLTTIANGFVLQKDDVLKKYQKFFSKVKIVEETFDIDLLVTDSDRIIYVSSKFESLKNQKISNSIKQILNNDLSGYSEKIKFTKDYVLNSSCYYTILKLDDYAKGVIVIACHDENKKEALLISEMLGQ